MNPEKPFIRPLTLEKLDAELGRTIRRVFDIEKRLGMIPDDHALKLARSEVWAPHEQPDASKLADFMRAYQAAALSKVE